MRLVERTTHHMGVIASVFCEAISRHAVQPVCFVANPAPRNDSFGHRAPAWDSRNGRPAWLSLLLALLLALSACSLLEDVPPVAHAGDDQTVKLGAPVTLDASKSREIDGGTIVEYRWQIVGVPKGKEADLLRIIATTKEPKTSVQLPNDDGALGVWTLEVKVTDNSGNRAANDVRITLVR